MQTKTNTKDIVFIFDNQYPFYVQIFSDGAVSLTEGEGQFDSPEWEDCDPLEYSTIMGNVFVNDENSGEEKMITYLLMLGIGMVSE